MNHFNAPHVIAADRIDSEVVIEFEDGRCGIYTSDLLYAALSQARPIPEGIFEAEQDDQSLQSEL